MNARFAVLSVLGVLLLGCAGLLDEGDDATPSGTATPTATPTGTPAGDVTPVSTTTVGEIVTFDFGTVPIVTNSPLFHVDIPANTIGIDFITLGAAADRTKLFLLYDMHAPDGGSVINAQATGPVRQSVNDGAQSFALPADNFPQSAVQTGEYTFRVAGFDGGSGQPTSSNPHVVVKARVVSGGAPDGFIDLNVIVVADPSDATWNATTLINSAFWTQTLAAVNGLYGTIGLALDDITYYDLSTTSFYAVETRSEMQQLFETSADIPDNRINLYVVGTLSNELAGAAGIAGGIPIPMQINGTQHSGVVITLQNDSTLTSEVIAHEAGHSLGLYHSSEFTGADFDPISDTPQCTVIGTNEPACPDYTNVMFPRLNSVMSAFTTGQGVVVRPSVHVKTVASPGFVPMAAPVPYVGPPTPSNLFCIDGVIRDVTPRLP